MKTIAVVDDNMINLKVAEHALKNDYRVEALTSGQALLDYMNDHVPDMILLDVMMPEMDGYQTMEKLQKLPQAAGIPVIFLTASSGPKAEIHGLQLGAVDFIFKPFVRTTMLQRIRNQMELADYRKNLEQKVHEKTQQIERIQDAIVISLTELVECRDGTTGGHSRRVAQYTGLLLDELLERNMFPDIVNEQYVEQIKRGAVLHDIGKVGIADMALLKESRLTEQEFEYMRQHTVFGGQALDRALEQIQDESFLMHARDTAYYQHEKWNGKGYPFGLQGEKIPLCARVLSIADVYDALTSKRSYKEPFSHETAVDIIQKDRGTAFDPTITDVFLDIRDKFEAMLEGFLKESE